MKQISPLGNYETGSSAFGIAPSNAQVPVHGPWTYGHFCGAGGMGIPINSLDSACMAHDSCYAQANLSPGSNFGLSHNSALQGCNQALCNAVQGVQSQIMAKVTAARNAFITRGGNIAANPSFTSPAEDSEYSAAGQIIGYFTIAPIIGNNGRH